MAQKSVQVVPIVNLLKARHCQDGVIYADDDSDRPIMFISGEDVGYTVVDNATEQPVEFYRVGVYLDSGQMQGFSNHSPRFRAIGSLECF